MLAGTSRRQKRVDRASARPAGVSLLTFSIDGSAVAAHRLVTRMIREQAAARNALADACTAAAGLLDELAASLEWSCHGPGCGEGPGGADHCPGQRGLLSARVTLVLPAR